MEKKTIPYRIFIVEDEQGPAGDYSGRLFSSWFLSASRRASSSFAAFSARRFRARSKKACFLVSRPSSAFSRQKAASSAL